MNHNGISNIYEKYSGDIYKCYIHWHCSKRQRLIRDSISGNTWTRRLRRLNSQGNYAPNRQKEPNNRGRSRNRELGSFSLSMSVPRHGKTMRKCRQVGSDSDRRGLSKRCRPRQGSHLWSIGRPSGSGSDRTSMKPKRKHDRKQRHKVFQNFRV